VLAREVFNSKTELELWQLTEKYKELEQVSSN
jgi:hypothetical protein